MRALVTGGSRGIGAAICAEFTARRIEVRTFSRSGTGEDATKPEHRNSVKEAVGFCDILVNNVGGGGRYGTDQEVWAKNVEAMVDFTNWALPGMCKNGWGRIVTISSIHGRERGASRAIFSAAKAAQISYMKTTSGNEFYARRGVTMNTVCPGNVKVDGKPLHPNMEALPMGRMGRPEEVAKLVAFLCSEDAAWINGSCIVIDGGESYAI